MIFRECIPEVQGPFERDQDLHVGRMQWQAGGRFSKILVQPEDGWGRKH